MKYDILVQKGGFFHVKVYLWIFFEQYLPHKKSGSFIPKIGGEKLSKSVSGYYKTKKKKKKAAWTNKPFGKRR